MINIICDGNYIFHKTFGIYGGYGDVDPSKVLKRKEDQASFIRKISTDLCYALKSLPTGGRLVFAADRKSWRRDVEIEGGGYKSGRVRDVESDWTIFYDLIKAFGTQVEKMGFIFSKVEGAEGDDLLLFWSEKFNELGENCIIITGDKDSHQLAKFVNGAWTAIWNNNSKNSVLTVPSGWSSDWLNAEEEVSIFSMGSSLDSDKDVLKTFLKKVSCETVDNKSFIFNKILSGDKGDSVPSVWNLQNGKVARFTEKKAEQVHELFVNTNWYSLPEIALFSNEEFLDWTSSMVLKTSKSVDNQANREKVKFNIKRNLVLMWLDRSVIPDFVKEGCEKELERGIALEKRAISLDRIKILEGTNWVTPGYVPQQYDPFDQLIK